jgi:putative transposase
MLKPETVVAWRRNAFRVLWTRRSGKGREGVRRSHRRSAFWLVAHPRRLSQARHRCRREQRKHVFGTQPEATIPDMAGIPCESHAKLGRSGLFSVPTIRFQILYVLVVLAHERRRIVHFAVTAPPHQNGLLTRCGTRSRGTPHHVICCVIVTASSAMSSLSKSRRCV